MGVFFIQFRDRVAQGCRLVEREMVLILTKLREVVTIRGNLLSGKRSRNAAARVRGLD